MALGKSPNWSAPSFQTEKHIERGLGEFTGLVERFEQVGSISAIMTSFYLQDSGSSPRFTFDSWVDLQVNGSSQQQSVQHSESLWCAQSRENISPSAECHLKGLSNGTYVKPTSKQVMVLYSFYKLRQQEICILSCSLELHRFISFSEGWLPTSALLLWVTSLNTWQIFMMERVKKNLLVSFTPE